MSIALIAVIIVILLVVVAGGAYVFMQGSEDPVLLDITSSGQSVVVVPASSTSTTSAGQSVIVVPASTCEPVYIAGQSGAGNLLQQFPFTTVEDATKKCLENPLCKAYIVRDDGTVRLRSAPGGSAISDTKPFTGRYEFPCRK